MSSLPRAARMCRSSWSAPTCWCTRHALNWPVLVTELCGYAQHIAAAGAGLLLPSPFEQSNFDHALLTMLTSPERSQWSDAGRRYIANIAANTPPTIEADLLETFAHEKRG